MKYKAVFFDAGGTLFEPNPSVGDIYARIASDFGMKTDVQKIEAAFRAEFSKRDRAANMHAHDTEKNEKLWWKELVKAVFEKTVQVQNFDSFFEALYDYFATAAAWRLFPESVSVVDELRKKNLILGIVSNWDSRLHSICKQMGLDKRFDFILASAVVGSAKPNSGIFQEALKQANVAASEALHVGDSIENDIEGAHRSKIDALLIDRSGRETENIKTIRSLSEIVPHLT